MRATVLALLAAVVAAGCVTPDALDDAGATDLLPDLPVVLPAVQIDAERWSGEPSILVLDDGTILVTGVGGMTRYAEDPTDAPGKFGQSYLWRSTDGGATWSFVDLGAPQPVGGLLPYRNAVLGVEGDLAADEAGRAYFVDLTMLALNGISASADGGATWTETQNPVVGRPGTDRPWVAALGDGEVYVKYLQTTLATGEWRVARSTDAGMTFLEDAAIPTCGQADMTVDLVAQEVLIPCGVGDDLFLLRTKAGATMDWERVEGPAAAGPTDNIFVSAAVARTGEYVFAWSETVDGGHRLRVAASLDRGATWTEPITVSGDNRSAIFPWVDANADGVVGVVWYEADAWGESDTLDATWYAMHARLTVTAAGLGLPATSALAEDPVHEGAICRSGLGCVLDGRGEDRRLLDFFEVDVDAAGASHVAFTTTRTPVPTVWYAKVG